MLSFLPVGFIQWSPRESLRLKCGLKLIHFLLKGICNCKANRLRQPARTFIISPWYESLSGVFVHNILGKFTSCSCSWLFRQSQADGFDPTIKSDKRR